MRVSLVNTARLDQQAETLRCCSIRQTASPRRSIDNHVDTLEDALCALVPKLADPRSSAKAVEFLAASIEGLKYAVAHPDEAAQIIVDNDPAGVAVCAIQLRQMREIAKLVGTGGNGVGNLDPASFNRTVDVLLSDGSTPIITKKPEAGAWTHAVWDKAITEVK